MRAAQVALISAIAHAPLLLYIAQLASPPARSRRGVASPIVPLQVTLSEAAAAKPIEVAFLVDEIATDAATRAPTSHVAAARTNAASTTSGRPGTDMGGGASSESTPSALMRMRGGRGPELGRAADLGLAAGVAERIAAASAADQPDELRKSGKLEPQPGGRAVVHDRVTTMTVDADGKAHFDDKKDIDPRFKLPVPKLWEVENMRRDLGHELTEWFKDPEAGKRYGPSSELPRHLQAAPGACDSWGATMCDDPLAPQIEARVRERKQVMGGFLAGPMDITAWLHRKLIGDPYSSRKLKLLADTLDERVAMGEAHRAQQRARSSEYMRKNLEQLWAREQNPVARRAALFELWDECSEDDAGARARAIVIGWIRTHLPAGSADAYTDEELAKLGKLKTSAAAFVPYGD